MSIHDDEYLIDLQVECARQDDRDSPYAGEDPPEDYLAEQASRDYRDHCDREHGGKDCDCSVPEGAFDAEAPF